MFRSQEIVPRHEAVVVPLGLEGIQLLRPILKQAFAQSAGVFSQYPVDHFMPYTVTNIVSEYVSVAVMTNGQDMETFFMNYYTDELVEFLIDEGKKKLLMRSLFEDLILSSFQTWHTIIGTTSMSTFFWKNIS